MKSKMLCCVAHETSVSSGRWREQKQGKWCGWRQGRKCGRRQFCKQTILCWEWEFKASSCL